MPEFAKPSCQPEDGSIWLSSLYRKRGRKFPAGGNNLSKSYVCIMDIAMVWIELECVLKTGHQCGKV